jgi:hypothetical protein
MHIYVVEVMIYLSFACFHYLFMSDDDHTVLNLKINEIFFVECINVWVKIQAIEALIWTAFHVICL